MDSLVAAARDKGYSYIAVTDHTKGLGIAHGLDDKRLAEQIAMIDAANRNYTNFTVLKGTEVDIRSDGTLDLADEMLEKLDIVIASIHSGFKQSRDQLTRRLLSAIRHPCVSVIAIPREESSENGNPMTWISRRYSRRQPGMGWPWKSTPIPCAWTQDQHVRVALEYGVPLIISTDSHVTNQFAFMHYGVSVARAAGRKNSRYSIRCP